MIPENLTVALENELPIFPCRKADKRPLTTHGCRDATTDARQIVEWSREHPMCNWGAAMGNGVFALDPDRKRGVDGVTAFERIAGEHGGLPNHLTNDTPNGGEHHFFRAAGIRNSAGKLAPGIDVRGEGGYVVIPPSQLVTGFYRWRDSEAPIPIAPAWLLDLVTSPTRRAIPEGARNDSMYRFACALRARNAPKDKAWADLQRSNATECDPPLSELELRTIFKNAWKHAPGYARSDTGNAQRFLDHHLADVRYVPAWREWILWTPDNRWVREPEALGCIARVKATILTALGTEVPGLPTPRDQEALARWLIQSQNTNRLESAVRNARSEPGVVLDAQLLDANRYLIGTQNGTLNLRDGEHRRAEREDFITKRLGCAFDASARAPKWDAFLTATTGGNVEMQRYLQHIVGLTLLGNLHRLVIFIYGPTSTGKSVFLEVIKALFGDYAKAAATDLLMLGALRTKHGPTEALARLDRARLLTVSETSSGDAFDEGQIKDLTGRDTLVARGMYQSSFEFRPDFTIWIRGNHKPRFSGDDAAILERLRLVPFTRQVPERERNPRLMDEIIAEELPGILNWALRGALAVQTAECVATPIVVQEATQEYAREMDTLGAFIDERCHVDDPAAKATAKELYEVFRQWSEAQGIRVPWLMQTFGRRMGERFTKKKSGDRWVYHGISLKPMSTVIRAGLTVAAGDQEPM